jgi:exodeoxyribonuclease VII large subunit
MFDSLMQPSPDQVLKVTALTRLIKGQLESNFSRIWVEGEISNLRKQSSGHVYFSLKDAGSQLPCALFARDAARQSFELEDGMQVLLLGDISVFEPHGRYQMIAKVAIQSGEGRLQLEFERLKRKLAAEGLFDAGRKRPLPVLPRKIAVITSPTGAALRDFLRILRRRDFRGEVILFPAKVQGKGAAEEVAAMLQYATASQGFDLIVLTRGGGSIEDLWAFNEESLARAVAASPLPVISAIGHEIDTVLTDFAADRRAETPSGAAELISSLYLEACARCEAAQQALLARVETQIRDTRSHLRDLHARMRIIAPERAVQHYGMRLDDLENQLSRHLSRRIAKEREGLSRLSERMIGQHPKVRIAMATQALNNFKKRLNRASRQAHKQKQESLSSLEKRLHTGSLQATLQRGYALMQTPDGQIIDRASLAANQPILRARFHDGEIQVSPKNT